MELEKSQLLKIEIPEVSKYSFLLYIGKNVDLTKKNTLTVWPHGSLNGPYDKTIEEAMEFFGPVNWYSDEFSLISLIPILPRTQDPQTHYPLDSQIMSTLTMINGGQDEFRKRPDLEVIKMFNYLKSDVLNIEDKFHLMGGSAGGQFTNRFSILHPQLVKTAGIFMAGDFMYPTQQILGSKLNYPFGINNLNLIDSTEFNLETYKKIPHFVFVGGQDTNSPLAYDLLFNDELIKDIKQTLGPTPVDRAKHFTGYLKELGMNIEFVLIEKLAHAVDRSAYFRMFEFFEEVLKEEKTDLKIK